MFKRKKKTTAVETIPAWEAGVHVWGNDKDNYHFGAWNWAWDGTKAYKYWRTSDNSNAFFGEHFEGYPTKGAALRAYKLLAKEERLRWETAVSEYYDLSLDAGGTTPLIVTSPGHEWTPDWPKIYASSSTCN